VTIAVSRDRPGEGAIESVPYEAAGHRRSPATLPGYHEGAPLRDKGLRYPADPPTVEEIVAVMRAAGDGPEGARLRALIVILWRAGLRIGEALDLVETDLDRARGAVLVRRGKGGRGRDVGMDRWGWAQLEPWLQFRTGLRAGALLCVIRGATAGRHWEQSAARKQLQRSATLAGVRRRFAPHQLRHARRRDGSRGRPAGRDPAPARACPPRDHIDLSAGVDSAEIIDTVHSRPAPVISATAGLRASR
jgi:integrase